MFQIYPIRRWYSLGYVPTRKIYVYLWDKLIGDVAFDSSTNCYAFTYDSEFCSLGLEVSPLHMPTNDVKKRFVFPDLAALTYFGLPSFLSDCLPDDCGNDLTKQYLQRHCIHEYQLSVLDKLAFMADRTMGALEFRPSMSIDGRKTTAEELNKIVEEAAEHQGGKLQSFSGDGKSSLSNFIALGLCSLGSRAKLLLAWNETTDEVVCGELNCPPGFRHWLLKFDEQIFDAALGVDSQFGRIEYAYHLMALASGIEMSQSRLIEENGNCHFMTKRFDRTSDGEKIHTLTLCGMAHLDYKKRETNSYESFFDTMVALNLPSSDFQEGFRRMVFNALAANCDDHTGNISFLMDKDGIWRLAPAYDLTFSYNPTGKWTHQHLMSINGKWKDFNRRDFICIANRYGVDDPESIIQQVYHAVTGWYDLGSQAGLSPIHIQRIEKAIMDRRGLLSI